ncbi:hypothetical protein LTR93_000538 [Exophiala xenobiotica]|nr:hypothetical protein LTR93_000538 [Exophiala xenobiotica]KAK5419763.1 hypothetical protein LTR06_001232 [Exophiala xenobiotica]
MAPKASEEKQRQQQIASAPAALQRLQKMSRPLPTIQESALLSLPSPTGLIQFLCGVNESAAGPDSTDMFLGESPSTLDDFLQLPSSLALTRKELRKYHIVYIASLTKLGQCPASRSCDASPKGASSEVRDPGQEACVEVKPRLGSGRMRGLGWWNWPTEFAACLVVEENPTFHYPGSAANTLEGAEPRIRTYGRVKRVAPEDIRRDYPHLERVAKHVYELPYEGYQLTHIGTLFRTRKPQYPKKDLNFRAWMKALEAAAMISFWLFWVCPRSIDHDDHYLRAACPWGPGHRHEQGDKCFRATHEKESCSQSLGISPERHQGLHPNSNARVQTVQTSHSSHRRYQVTVVASVELRLSQNLPRSSAHSSDF